MSSIENTIERLAILHGRVYVSKTYMDGLLSVTAYPARECLLTEDGVISRERINWSVNWNEGLDSELLI